MKAKAGTRNRKNSEGIFDFDNVGSGHYKVKCGQQIWVDDAGWIDESYGKFQYLVLAVEIMMSSNLRGEISGLKKIKALYAAYVLDIDASGNLNRQLIGYS